MRPGADVQTIDRNIVWLLLGGLLLKLAYLAQLATSPLGTFLFSDFDVYHRRALAILAGDVIGHDAPFFSSTLYPYLVAAIYAISSKSPIAVYSVQMLVGTLTALVLYLFVRELMDERRARVALALSLLCGPFAFFEGQLVMISWTVLGVALALFGWARAARTGEVWASLLAGAGLGLAASDKPNLLVLALLLPLAWRPPPPWPRRIAAFAVGILVTLGPVLSRNLLATSGRVALSLSTGINLAIGNHASADGMFREPWLSDPTTAHDASRLPSLSDASRYFASRAMGRELDAVEADRYWRSEALAFAASHPLESLRLFGKKLLLFLNAREIPNVVDFEFYRKELGMLRLLTVGSWLLVPLGLVGAAAALRRRALSDRALLLFFALYAGSVALLFVSDRFRQPIFPVLIVFAADALVSAHETLREHGLGRLKPSHVAAFLVFVAIPFLPLTHFDHARNYVQLAEASAVAREPERAVAAFRASLAIDPTVGEVWNNLGLLLVSRGRLDEAGHAFDEAIRVAPRLAYPHRNRGDLARLRNEPKTAMDSYRRAVAIDPHIVDAWLSLARLQFDAGDLAAAQRTLMAGHDANPGVPRFAELLRDLGQEPK